jgi:hypothetical protein
LDVDHTVAALGAARPGRHREELDDPRIESLRKLNDCREIGRIAELIRSYLYTMTPADLRATAPLFLAFCGVLCFCHKLSFDRSSLTHWHQRLGEESWWH